MLSRFQRREREREREREIHFLFFHLKPNLKLYHNKEKLTLNEIASQISRLTLSRIVQDIVDIENSELIH